MVQETNILKFSKQGKMVIGITFVLLTMIIAYLTYLTVKINNQSFTISEMIYDIDACQEIMKRYDSQFSGFRNDLNNVISKLDTEAHSQRLTSQDLQEKLTELTYPSIQNKNLNDNISLSVISKVLNLAELNLSLLKDKNTYVQLLSFSKQWLEESNNPAFSSLISAIQEDIDMINNLEFPDKQHIWQTVTTLLKNSDKYPYRKTIKVDPTPVTSTENTSWKEVPHRLWQELTKQIKVRHSDSGAPKHTAYYSESLTKQQLNIIFEQIRLASINENNELYKSNITSAKQLLTEYFEEDSDVVKQTLSELDELAKIEFHSILPITMRSIPILNTLNKASNT